MSRVIDLTGMNFGRLTVVSLSHLDERANARWTCQCSCGVVTVVRSQALRMGRTHSCGCLKRELLASKKTHGKSKSKEFWVWQSMLQRCNNSRDPAYKNYGGRGIAVCGEWGSFENFLNDMGLRPTSKHSIERRNNDKGYCKENCYWATRREQSRNHRRNRYIDTPLGRMLLCDAEEKSGIKAVTLRSRLRRGWPADRLFDPVSVCLQ